MTLRSAVQAIVIAAVSTSTSWADSLQPVSVGVVTRVIDGDTIECEVGRELFTIRLLGIDAPESVHPEKGMQPFGAESANHLNQMLVQKIVRIETGEGEKADKYGRSLCYVYLGEGQTVTVNEIVVALGWARSYRDYPCRLTPVLNALEAAAKYQQLGMWNPAAQFDATEEAIPEFETQEARRQWLMTREGALRELREARQEASRRLAIQGRLPLNPAHLNAVERFIRDVDFLHQTVKSVGVPQEESLWERYRTFASIRMTPHEAPSQQEFDEAVQAIIGPNDQPTADELKRARERAIESIHITEDAVVYGLMLDKAQSGR